MPDRVGQQFGSYHLTRLLAEGQVGDVYLGEDMSSKVQVAIKVLKTQLTYDALKKLIEGEPAFKLEHPHIMQVHSYNVEGADTPYLVMNYAPNQSLREHQPPKQDVIAYIKQISEALEYAHDKGVVHGNINPTKFLVGQNGEILLNGLGIATITRGSPMSFENSAGDISYMAPEQHYGHLYPASDQYALGVIAWEWLSGEKLFSGSDSEIINQHLSPSPPPFKLGTQNISPEIGRVLLKALAKSPQKRFKTVIKFAAALEKAYELAQDLDPISATISTAEPIVITNTSVPSNGLEEISASLPPNTLEEQRSKIATTSSKGRKRSIRILILLIAVTSLVLVALLFSNFFNAFFNPHMGATPNVAQDNSLGVIQVHGEFIGISNGTFSFDTNRTDGNLKQQAARDLKNEDVNDAEILWRQAVAKDPNDAESLIYLEDQRILDAHLPYITIVVGTILTGEFTNTGRDSLQGAYVAQREYNENCKLSRCVQIRLLIANSGSGDPAINGLAYAGFIMQQIVLAARADKTIVGLMGWPLSSDLLYVNTVLESANIPIVSPVASLDSSTQTLPELFHVAPPNSFQGVVGAEYAEQTLHIKKVALFVDPLDPYSDSLATAFRERFTADGNTIVATEIYTVGNPSLILSGLQDALQLNPELIYFAGHTQDVNTLLVHLPSCRLSPCPIVLGGDALNEFGTISGRPNNFNRLRFTAFAYPDEWSNLGHSSPVFFSEYTADFSSSEIRPPTPYGYTRADSGAILSYDAMLAMLEASRNILGGRKTNNFTSEDLQQALIKITATQAIQGVSGQIAFESGNPIDKPIVVVCVDQNNFTHLEEVYGQFLKGEPVETRHLDQSCI